MRILLKPACQRRLWAELNIGFVRDHQRFTARHFQQGTDILWCDNLPGWIVRATDKHDFYAVKIVGNPLQIQLPVLQRLHVAARHAEGFGADAVHAVGRLAVHYCVFSRLAERADQQFNAFVCPTADQHLLRLHACVLGVVFDYRFRLTLRITVQRLLRQLKLHRRREFVGVQPDIAFATQAARGLIRRQATDIFAG